MSVTPTWLRAGQGDPPTGSGRPSRRRTRSGCRRGRPACRFRSVLTRPYETRLRVQYRIGGTSDQLVAETERGADVRVAAHLEAARPGVERLQCELLRVEPEVALGQHRRAARGGQRDTDAGDGRGARARRASAGGCADQPRSITSRRTTVSDSEYATAIVTRKLLLVLSTVRALTREAERQPRRRATSDSGDRARDADGASPDPRSRRRTDQPLLARTHADHDPPAAPERSALLRGEARNRQPRHLRRRVELVVGTLEDARPRCLRRRRRRCERPLAAVLLAGRRGRRHRKPPPTRAA